MLMLPYIYGRSGKRPATASILRMVSASMVNYLLIIVLFSIHVCMYIRTYILLILVSVFHVQSPLAYMPFWIVSFPHFAP